VETPGTGANGSHNGAGSGNGAHGSNGSNGFGGMRSLGRPVRKDEIVLEERGLYIESWLPERRSRRRPLLLLHGELGGSWLWERYLLYFAQRGWEGHALNLRAHFWSENADFEELDVDTYVDDAIAALEALGRPAVVIGHGMGGLLAMKVAEQRQVHGLVLLSPALPRPIRPEAASHVVRLVPPRFRREFLGWAGPPDQIQRQHPDLSMRDVMRVQHLMGAESGAARRQMLEGVPVERELLSGIPTLVVGAGVDRWFPEPDSERLAEWLGAEYQPFGAHSHYGLVIGEESHEQVADAIRAFLEHHRL
jgi:pimeloyl-ACP methyl ester carboxylesterase